MALPKYKYQKMKDSTFPIWNKWKFHEILKQTNKQEIG